MTDVAHELGALRLIVFSVPLCASFLPASFAKMLIAGKVSGVCASVCAPHTERENTHPATFQFCGRTARSVWNRMQSDIVQMIAMASEETLEAVGQRRSAAGTLLITGKPRKPKPGRCE
uniref:Uncharacterized protein n=1 Tax=Anopheles maculatus TaxID=74869 RepID=A0A182T2I9_9DIPT